MLKRPPSSALHRLARAENVAFSLADVYTLTTVPPAPEPQAETNVAAVHAAAPAASAARSFPARTTDASCLTGTSRAQTVERRRCAVQHIAG